MQDDDFSLFRAAVSDVKPIEHDRADTGKPKADTRRSQVRQAAASHSTQAYRVDGLSDQFILDVSPDESLYWSADGVQISQMHKLKQGQIPFEGTLDLHGMTVEKARNTLWEFLSEAIHLRIRCVRVTHGKAARLDGRRPLLKSHVNTWLRQHPHILGFASCQARHGGTGAVYILLKRSTFDGRDES